MPNPTFMGIGFPFKKGSTSFPNQATDNDLIKQALIQLIMTQRGERVMRPDYGTDAWKFVFEDNNTTLGTLMRTEVARAVTTNERRVVLVGVGVDRDNAGSVILTIQYVIPQTSQSQTVQVPLS
jgi:phage baseplate assembly protein W